MASHGAKRTGWAQHHALLLIVLFRLVNAFSIATFFQPDEYFQVLEPAWQMAFGSDSGAWITWEWHYQLRSSIHPLFFAAVYRLADLVLHAVPLAPPLRDAALIAAPKAAQAVFAGLGDWFTWKLAERLYGRGSAAAWSALAMTLANPWQWYSSVRTFSNSVETTLTVAALYYWPWELLEAPVPVKGNSKGQTANLSVASVSRLRMSLVIAAVAVILRPTNLFVWLAVLPATLSPCLVDRALRGPALPVVLVLVREILLCGSLTLAAAVVLDRWYFGEWTLPAYKWLYFNVSKSLAVFYGTSPWHYHLVQSIPLLCTTVLPFALLGLYGARRQSPAVAVLAATVYVTVLILSLVSHKEVRFSYPLLPALHVVAAPCAASFFLRTESSRDGGKAPGPSSPIRKTLKNKPILVLGLLVNALLAFFLSRLHQPAPISVLHFLRTQHTLLHPPLQSPSSTQPQQQPEELFALFLTPCHTTPWRSHLIHPSLRARALTCEPPLHTEPNSAERASYRDEADRFYDDPVAFLSTEMWPVVSINDVDAESKSEREVPRYIVGFEGIEPHLKTLFASELGAGLGIQLERVWEGWNGFFNEDWRRSGKLIVWDTGLYK